MIRFCCQNHMKCISSVLTKRSFLMFKQVKSLKNQTEVKINDHNCQHETLKLHHHWKYYAMYMSGMKRSTNTCNE